MGSQPCTATVRCLAGRRFQPIILPTFIVVGAQRSGTTWLDRVLRSHASVYMPDRRKEIHYFDDYFHRGLKWYSSFFPGDLHGYRALGEVTPKYLYHPAVPDRIREQLGPVQILAILRDPIQRAYSQYRLYRSRNAYGGTFLEFVQQHPNALERGLYAAQLERYSWFRSRGLLVVFQYERDIINPVNLGDTLAGALGLDDPQLFDIATDRIGQTHESRMPRLRRTAMRTARTLRHADLDFIVEAGKTMGAERLFRRSPDATKPSLEERRELFGLFKDDARRVSEEYGIEVSKWDPLFLT